LDLQPTAIFCSSKCPGDVILKATKWISDVADDEAATIVGGFHSAMEKSFLEILLDGRCRLIVCPARSLVRYRLPAELKPAMSAGRVVVFDLVASELSQLVQQYTAVNLESEEQSGADDQESNSRIIADLDREIPHSLDEDFTFKRPFGFVLSGRATTGVTTWQRMYELICLQLMARGEERFRSLTEHPDFISNRGNHAIATNPAELRKAMRLADDLFIESNLSANGIRDVILRLFACYNIPADSIQVYLRQDRNASEQGLANQ
jgi:hypothetical protein